MTALFVAGTGTGVGKTYCTVQLVRAARARGVRVDAIKPVISGYDAAAPRGSDTAELVAALGAPLDEAHVARSSPWRFREPLSPDMAARREGRRIAFEELVEFCKRSAQGSAELTLVEGVGGVMVPLDDAHTVLDWIAALASPVVLVAGSYLGTLSHTLTAVLALQAHGCELAAVLVAESPAQPVQIEETARTIERFLPPLCAERPPPVAVVPRGGTHENVTIFAELVERYGRS